MSNDIRKAAEHVRAWLADDQMSQWRYMESGDFYADLGEKIALLDAALAAEQPQPVAWMLRSSRGDAFHAGSTPPQPADVFPWAPLYAAPPPAVPEPSEAEVEAAWRAIPASHEDSRVSVITKGDVWVMLRAAAAARGR